MSPSVCTVYRLRSSGWAFSSKAHCSTLMVLLAFHPSFVTVLLCLSRVAALAQATALLLYVASLSCCQAYHTAGSKQAVPDAL